MHTCPLLRVSMESRNVAAKHRFATRTNSSIPGRRLAMLLASLAGLIGWRALRDVLDAIPDSNDDFGLF
ncbi:hypothetical protein [Paraburkholderia lacunae]|uniref:Uncharacterized protein n=1 Tax=Paraburkholderia lacunae TaxID=2211104 RepID=A0A370N2N4_9BURK|nr:hypothetical protein [Paraburkholderia lacunae]RDJ99865.1 hypothetical protein DLM46_25815 [Paraburkholderia lacunae]